MTPDSLAKLQPIYPRHAYIQQNKVGLQGQLRQGIFCVVNLPNQISALGQVRVQQVGEHRLVVNHENLLGHVAASNLANHKTGKSKNCQARAVLRGKATEAAGQPKLKQVA